MTAGGDCTPSVAATSCDREGATGERGRPGRGKDDIILPPRDVIKACDLSHRPSD